MTTGYFEFVRRRVRFVRDARACHTVIRRANRPSSLSTDRRKSHLLSSSYGRKSRERISVLSCGMFFANGTPGEVVERTGVTGNRAESRVDINTRGSPLAASRGNGHENYIVVYRL